MSNDPRAESATFDCIQNFVVDGECNALTAADWAAFEQLLRKDEAACREYAEYMAISVLLRSVIDAMPDEKPARAGPLAIDAPSLTLGQAPGAFCIPTIVQNTFDAAPSWLLSYLVAIAITAVGLIVGANSYVHQSVQDSAIAGKRSVPSSVASPTKETLVIGQITGAVDCVLKSGECRMMGEKLRTAANGIQHFPVALGDRIALRSGLLEITYNTGASVILEGPVNYHVDSAAGGYLSVGKLTARLEKKAEETIRSKSSVHLPPSTFVVTTPTATVTDLGTEFAVEVNEKGDTTSHVFRGRIKLEIASTHGSAHSYSRILQANDSAKVEQDAGQSQYAIHTVVLDPGTFVRSDRLRDGVLGAKLTPFRHWQAYSQELRRDPSLLAYYDFQRLEGRASVLADVADRGKGACGGVVHDAVWTAGRVLGKHALLFQQADDYVSVDLPETTDDLSLLAWICMWRIENPIGALLTSESWEKTGQMHWQVLHDGAVSLTLWNGKNYTYKSAPVLLDTQLSRWVQTAVVYDHRARLVKFYHDGRLIGVQPIKEHVPICIGRACIGNWRVGDLPGDPRDPATFQVRNFRGRIDEMAIFRRALSDTEIRRAFEAGRPAANSQSGRVSSQPNTEAAAVKKPEVQSK